MPKVFRNADVMWREEEESRAEAYEGLEKGSQVEDIGTSLLFADGVMVTLNLIGTEIWKLCDGRELEDILAALLDEFDVEPQVLQQDVLAFLEDLSQKGFIFYG
jgi:GeoRSP system PqqD family protein